MNLNITRKSIAGCPPIIQIQVKNEQNLKDIAFACQSRLLSQREIENLNGLDIRIFDDRGNLFKATEPLLSILDVIDVENLMLLTACLSDDNIKSLLSYFHPIFLAKFCGFENKLEDQCYDAPRCSMSLSSTNLKKTFLESNSAIRTEIRAAIAQELTKPELTETKNKFNLQKAHQKLAFAKYLEQNELSNDILNHLIFHLNHICHDKSSIPLTSFDLLHDAFRSLILKSACDNFITKRRSELAAEAEHIFESNESDCESDFDFDQEF